MKTITHMRPTMRPPTVRPVPSQKQDSPAPQSIFAEVQRRAYQLYEERGRIDGWDLDDWLRAESEILGQKNPAA